MKLFVGTKSIPENLPLCIDDPRKWLARLLQSYRKYGFKCSRCGNVYVAIGRGGTAALWVLA